MPKQGPQYAGPAPSRGLSTELLPAVQPLFLGAWHEGVLTELHSATCSTNSQQHRQLHCDSLLATQTGALLHSGQPVLLYATVQLG